MGRKKERETKEEGFKEQGRVSRATRVLPKRGGNQTVFKIRTAIETLLSMQLTSLKVVCLNDSFRT